MGRQFDPIAFFLTSDLKQSQYQSALQSTVDMFKAVTGITASTSFFMADADHAERNACEATVTGGPSPKFEMCWFHVVQNIKKHTSKISLANTHLVYKHMYRMHFSRNDEYFTARKQESLEALAAHDEIKLVADHISRQWLTGGFTEWQSHCSPPGYAKTNNPLEQFNGALKRDYTHWNLLTLNSLQMLLSMSRHCYARAKPFLTEPRPPHEMIQRYKALVKADALTVSRAYRSSILFLLDGVSHDKVFFVTERRLVPAQPIGSSASGRRPDDVKKIEREAQEHVDVSQQPSFGWTEDAVRGHYGCRSWVKWAYCVHLIACREALKLPVEGMSMKRTTFVNTRRKKGRGRQGAVGPALSIE